MMVFTALDAMAHNPQLTLGKMFPAPKEWTGSAWGKDPLEWNILDYQHGLVTAYCKDKNRAHFIRFDEEFNIKSSFSAKVLPEAEELSHRIYDQKIHFILQEHEDIVHLVFDEQSLQLLKQETLFKMKTTKYAAVEVKYAEHGDFAAIDDDLNLHRTAEALLFRTVGTVGQRAFRAGNTGQYRQNEDCGNQDCQHFLHTVFPL